MTIVLDAVPTSPPSPSADAGELLSELDLGSARGARSKGPPVVVEVLRSLAPEDLPLLLQRAAPALPAEVPTLVKLRHSHHQLARLIACGTEQAEIALITGYSPSYISNIQRNPQFADLVATYEGQRELAFIDVIERMKAMGLTCLEELQEQLAVAPEKWSRRELMELAELLLIKPSRGPASASAGHASAGAAVSINVKFVGAPESGVIDITPERIEK